MLDTRMGLCFCRLCQEPLIGIQWEKVLYSSKTRKALPLHLSDERQCKSTRPHVPEDTEMNAIFLI